MKLHDTEQSRNSAAILAFPATAMALAWLWAARPDWLGLLFGAVLLACVADIVIADWEFMIVPDRAIAAMFAAGWLERLAASGWDSAEIAGAPALAHVMRSVALGGGAWLLARLYRAIRGREGLGMGDVKLIAAAGAWLSLDAAMDAITLAAVGALATMAALCLVANSRRDASGPWLSRQIPFAVFLAPAFWLMWTLTR